MKTPAAMVLAALVGNAAAFPQLADKITLERRQDANAWQAPGPGDVRTACPGLNTLANHGFINHNGRGITLQQMQQGFLDAFGFAFEVTQAGGNNALALQGNGATTFDLDTLNQPHTIEHDASLTRDDAQMAFDQNANNHDFNATIWGMTLDWYGPVTHIDVSSANTARLGRVQQAQQQDFPGWFVENDPGSLAEHSFMLNAMNDPTVGTPQNPLARLDWVSYWVSNQRLPTDIGWVKPSGVSGDQFNAISAAVQNAPTTSPQPRSSTTTTSGSTSSSSSSGSATTGPSTTGSSTTGLSTTGPSTTGPSSNSAVSGSGGSSSFPTTYPYSNATTSATPSGPVSTPASPTTSLPSLPPQVTSSASAVATSLAGSPPPVPCGYRDQLSHDQWQQVKGAIGGYVTYVETIIVGLCGAHGVGGMPVPGNSGSGGAPWYGSMPSSGAPAPAPAPAPTGGLGPYIASGVGGIAPQNTCAC